LTSSAGARAYVKPEVSFAVYGVLAGYANAEVYGEILADINNVPWWQLYAGLDFNVGARATIWGYEFFDVERNVLELRWLLAQASGGNLPSPPTLSSPTNGSTNIFIPALLSWNPSSGAASYTLQVSTNNNFTSYVYNQSGLTGTSQQLSDLNNTTQYYWRVSASNNQGTSDWSNVWNFTTTGVPSQAWFDDFESYSTGSFPNTWTADGNGTDISTNYINNTVSYGGTKSLQLFGVIGGCWGALAYRPLIISPPFEVEVAIRNGNETLSGCHPDRVAIGIRQGTYWGNPGRGFVSFNVNGDIVSSGGSVLQTYTTLTWYKVRIRYEKTTNTQVRLSYWINDVYKGAEELTAYAEEDQMTNLQLVVQEGSAWFDDVNISN